MAITKETILENMENPELLEELYNANKKIFSDVIYDLSGQESPLIIKYWYARLFYKTTDKPGNNIPKYVFVVFLIVLAWIPIRLVPVFSYGNMHGAITNLIPVVFSFALSLYFLFKPEKVKYIAVSFLMNAAVYAYLLLLPARNASQSLTNVFYFMFVLLWFFVLSARSKFKIKELEITGETIVWCTLFILGGGVILLLSTELFYAIGINASDFYYENIVTLGLAAAPD